MHASTEPVLGFATTGLSPVILAALTRLHLSTPTPIQARAIPVALTGCDIIGLAETGTGKTFAFGLPILERLIEATSEQALILVPTRELALQVEESLRKITSLLPRPIRTISLIGGMPMYRQVRELGMRPRIIVATPGRLRDHLEQGTLHLDRVSMLVLDEADRMLDMGFAPQITFICNLVPKARQTLLFSATFPPEIAGLAGSFMREPARIEISRAGTSATTISQELCYVQPDNKLELLKKILDEKEGTVLVFSRTKHGASKLNRKLAEIGHTSAEIHSNRSLGQRREALQGFKNGKYRVLVATDVAARGIDVQDIALVVNFDLPDASEDYVHRIGRTGRAGKDGHAISFATPDQHRDVRAIEKLVGKPLPLSQHSDQAPRAVSYEPQRKAYSSGGRSGYRGGNRGPRRSFGRR